MRNTSDPAAASSRRASVWWQMISGMRAYAVAITVVWALSATSMLAVFAIAASRPWVHAAFGGAAAAELAFSLLTLSFLRRASEAGRFDV